MDIMDKFHKAMYSIYEKNNPKLRKELRNVIRDSTKKMEKIDIKNYKIKTKKIIKVKKI